MWPDRTNCELVREFKKGDLIYGLNNIRQIYAVRIREKIDYKHVTVDTINNNYMFMYDYDRNGVPEELHGYFNYYRNGSGYGRKEPKKGIKADLDNQPWDIRRLCKSAIKYTVRKGFKIRFVVDGIDFARVVTKCRYQPYDDTYHEDDSYTASELRFIYRNWLTLKFNIVFYSFGERIQPPWRNNPAAWRYCIQKYNEVNSPALLKRLTRDISRSSGSRTV
ncbi:hypothetical protein P0136_13200 [Lentisphaerota bacterium ZTH]|nr:hypothetical protein JYG24_09285 [Lentisphaerota bacterium]WET06315.1 hypothetical protein P0136_13200 [Lentisphaerota bacterium ZTH]